MIHQVRALRRWRLALAAPLVVSLTVPAIILAQSPNASIVERANQVEYSPSGSSQWQAAPADVALAPGGRLRTGAGSRARVGFFDGTTTALSATTGIRVDRLDADPQQVKITQSSGITQSRVAAGSAFALDTAAFSVAAPAASCPWVRIDADGTTLVRNYGPGAGPAVDPQPVQDVVFS